MIVTLKNGRSYKVVSKVRVVSEMIDGRLVRRGVREEDTRVPPQHALGFRAGLAKGDKQELFDMFGGTVWVRNVAYAVAPVK